MILCCSTVLANNSACFRCSGVPTRNGSRMRLRATSSGSVTPVSSLILSRTRRSTWLERRRSHMPASMNAPSLGDEAGVLEAHRRRGVAEHRLDDVHARPVRKFPAGEGGTQIVDADALALGDQMRLPAAAWRIRWARRRSIGLPFAEANTNASGP